MKPPALLIASLVLWLGPAAAQSNTEYRLFPADQPATEAPPEEVIYRPRNLDDRGFNRVVQAISVPTLTVYHPAQPRPDRAAMVICPGGGYRYVVIDREGHALARHFQQRGFTVAVLKYRLPQPPLAEGELPLSLQDSLEAVRQVRRHAAAWNINRHRIGIMGASAGGHLAASTAVFAQPDDLSRPDFVALLYPVISLEPPHAHGSSRTRLLGEDASAAQVAAYSLNHRAHAGVPPFFMVHALNDTAVPAENSRLMAAALRAVGVPSRLLLVDSGGHGFALGRGGQSDTWPDEFVAWLDGLKATP